MNTNFGKGRSYRSKEAAGDFNINLLKLNESETCCEFFDLLTSQSLFPHITLPTRLTNGCYNALYLIMCLYVYI